MTTPKAPAYLIARMDVQDLAGFDDYRAAVTPVIAQFGGRYLVRGGAMEVMEGPQPPGRIVVVEFPDLAAAHAFYHSPEYAPALRMRLDSTVSELVLVEGA